MWIKESVISGKAIKGVRNTFNRYSVVGIPVGRGYYPYFGNLLLGEVDIDWMTRTRVR